MMWFAIPKASREEHVIENAKTGSIILSRDILDKLDKVFLKLSKKVRLDIV